MSWVSRTWCGQLSCRNAKLERILHLSPAPFESIVLPNIKTVLRQAASIVWPVYCAAGLFAARLLRSDIAPYATTRPNCASIISA